METPQIRLKLEIFLSKNLNGSWRVIVLKVMSRVMQFYNKILNNDVLECCGIKSTNEILSAVGSGALKSTYNCVLSLCGQFLRAVCASHLGFSLIVFLSITGTCSKCINIIFEKCNLILILIKHLLNTNIFKLCFKTKNKTVNSSAALL